MREGAHPFDAPLVPARTTELVDMGGPSARSIRRRRVLRSMGALATDIVFGTAYE